MVKICRSCGRRFTTQWRRAQLCADERCVAKRLERVARMQEAFLKSFPEFRRLDDSTQQPIGDAVDNG